MKLLMSLLFEVLLIFLFLRAFLSLGSSGNINCYNWVLIKIWFKNLLLLF